MKWSLWFALPGILSAQCAQCFRTAAAQSAAGVEALNQGIVLLLAPSLLLLCGFAWIAYRRRGG